MFVKCDNKYLNFSADIFFNFLGPGGRAVNHDSLIYKMTYGGGKYLVVFEECREACYALAKKCLMLAHLSQLK